MAEADPAFYRLSQADLVQALKTTEHGLSDGEAAARLQQVGPNRLTVKKKVSAIGMYLEQFANSLILTLIGAAILIFFVWYFGARERSDLVEGSLILAIVILITVLGFVQEWKAEKAIDALKKLLAFKAKIVREGKIKEIDVGNLVPGDLVILEEGTKVPADIRLIEVATLQANEASLTGESAPVNKMAEPLDKEKLQLADQKNMIFSGTVVTQGRGKGIVVETGDRTEIGKIASFVAETEEEETPIQKRLDQVGKMLGLMVLAISAIVFLFIVFFAADLQSLPLLERIIHSFIAAVSLAVAAIPEGLPAVVTIALALGTQRMLKRNALVRKLNSVETLGSTDVICADKTGTLTKGEMTVREIYVPGKLVTVTGSGYDTSGEFQTDGKRFDPKELEALLTVGLVCNNAHLNTDHSIVGDPTEAALLVSAGKAKLSSTARRLAEVPFSSARKMMSVAVEEGGQQTVYTKGAPEVLLPHCSKILLDGKEVALTDKERKDILDHTEQMSQRALRVLGFAYRHIERGADKEMEHDLVFVGLQGMSDPPRADIKPLITRCHEAGIRVIMITGDHAATAAAVAKEIGLTGEAMTGADLDTLSDGQFQKIVEEVNVYARVNPGFKMRIIEALKKHGHIVAMTGDGVNDAPALKKADIGIAMGITGTDVAKEASDMVLLDDHFASIVSAIEEGRGIFDNIRKFVNYLLSCNIGEVIVVFAGVLLFKDVVLTATMLLWINVVTDGPPAVALGMDPAEQDIIRYSPKKFQGEIITRSLWWEMIVYSLFISVAVLVLYALNLKEGVPEARAAAFMAIVLFELLRLFHVRAKYRVSLLSNPWLLAAAGSSVLLQLCIVAIPFLAGLFEVQNIDLFDWLYIMIAGAVIWLGFNGVQGLIRREQAPLAHPKPALPVA